MKNDLSQRLNAILPRVTDPEFLANTGIGNETACYIFDYAADQELVVRDHIATALLPGLRQHHAQLDVVHIDLYAEILSFFEENELTDLVVDLDDPADPDELLEALKGALSADRLVEFLAGRNDLRAADLTLVSGVGSAWPMVRAHTLLNCLHPVIGNTPLVLFYPGTYNGSTLRLFGRIASGAERPGAYNYYRAFTLIPH